MTPPLALPSSLVRTTPVAPAASTNFRAWTRPLTPVVASRTSSVSWGAPGTSRAATRRILASSSIRFFFVCSRPAVSTRSVPDAPRFRRRESVEEHGRGIGALLVPDDRQVQAVGPGLKLVDGARAERVRRREQDAASGRLLAGRELRRRRRLARAVHAHEKGHEEGHVGPPGRARRRGQELLDLFAEKRSHVREVFALRDVRALPDGVGQGRGRVRSDVGGEQRLLEGLEDRLVDPQALFDRGAELFQDLGVGHEEAALDLGEKAPARRLFGRSVEILGGSRVVGHGEGKITQESREARVKARAASWSSWSSREAGGPWRRCRPSGRGPRRAGGTVGRVRSASASRGRGRAAGSPRRS